MPANNPSSHSHLALAFAMLLAAFCQFCLSAQVSFTNPIRITQRDGLPSNTVYCMAQDAEGFLWFGTREGLCRYDGAAFQVFQNVPGDSASLCGNFVRSLLFDAQHNELWAGTMKGLSVLDLCTGKFRSHFHVPDDLHSLPEDQFSRTIFKDRQGTTWVGFENNGFARYNRAAGNFDRFAYQPSASDKGERLNLVSRITQIRQDLRNDSILWLGTASGLLKFNKVSHEFSRFYQDLGDKLFNITANSTYCMHLHPDGKVYLGAWGGFLNIFDPATETFRQVSPSLSQKGNGVVRKILQKSERELWVTTDQGLCIYDTERNAFTTTLRNDPSGKPIFWAEYQDKQGRIWGRSDSGIYLFDPLNEQFQQYQPLPSTRDKLPFLPMKVLQAPGKDLLWVNGVNGKGLRLLDRKTGEWKTILPPPDFFEDHPVFNGRDLVYLQDGRLLVLEESTLFTLSSDGRSLTRFPQQPNGKGTRFMKALQDHEGRIWIGSVNGGLFRLDPTSGESRNFQDDLLGEAEKGQAVSIGNLFEDSRRNIWIQAGGGFSVYDSRRDVFLNFRYRPGKTNVFKHITGFVEDGEGNILIGGSTEEGIGIADVAHPEKGIFKTLKFPGSAPFLPEGMTWDAEGNLWIDDETKLTKLNLRDRSLKSFDGFDGLAAEEDDPKSVKINGLDLLPSGEMVICYSDGKGIGIFHPGSLRRNEEAPRPYLASFAVFDREITGDTNLFYRKNIVLPFSQNFFSFEFSAIAFTHPHENRFKYKLEGFDPDWIFPAAGRRYASYSGVRAGRYTLRVAVANSEVVWNEEELQVKIQILPPWHRSWWAYLIYAAGLLAAGLSVYRFLKQRWHLKMQLKWEHTETLRLQELDALKTRLYTNITHEFRTPLTIISGMAEEVKSEIGKLKIEKLKIEKLEIGKLERPPISNFQFPNFQFLFSSLDMIKRNSQSLLRLVNQMLDLSKIESGNMPLHLIRGDVVSYLKYVVESFHSLAEAKNIRLEMQTDLTEFVMDFDEEKLLQIVSNLLSNAIKFTPEGGSVRLAVSSGQRAESNKHATADCLLINVNDTGIGIPPEKLPRIFERFYQVESAVSSLSANSTGSSTGIGLTLTKELVKLMSGEISVKSEAGVGTTVEVRLPVTTNAEFGMPRRSVGAEFENPNLATKPAPPLHSAFRIPHSALPHLLLIEDNPDVVRYLAACLEKDYRLDVARNGREGVEKALDTVPDLILSDVMMPEMDGFEVCRTLKNDERTSHIPVILLTAKADVVSRLEGLERGADAYLAKPFDKEELRVRVRKLLELRQRLQQHYLTLATAPAGATTTPQIAQAGNAEMENAFVQKVRAIVEKHLNDHNFDLARFSREAAMSASQLHRKLVALTGLSPNRFIRNIRLGKAKMLLLETEETVSDIAYETGFSDPDYFIRAFRQEFGMPPAAFKKQAKDAVNRAFLKSLLLSVN